MNFVWALLVFSKNMKVYSVLIFCLFTKYILAQNIAPTIIASGNQNYCPLSEINVVTDFDIIRNNFV